MSRICHFSINLCLQWPQPSHSIHSFCRCDSDTQALGTSLHTAEMHKASVSGRQLKHHCRCYNATQDRCLSRPVAPAKREKPASTQAESCSQVISITKHTGKGAEDGCCASCCQWLLSGPASRRLRNPFRKLRLVLPEQIMLIEMNLMKVRSQTCTKANPFVKSEG